MEALIRLIVPETDLLVDARLFLLVTIQEEIPTIAILVRVLTVVHIAEIVIVMSVVLEVVEASVVGIHQVVVGVLVVDIHQVVDHALEVAAILVAVADENFNF